MWESRGIEKHFLPARLYSSFKDRRFDRRTNAAKTGWIERTGGRNGMGGRKGRNVALGYLREKRFGRDRPEENLPRFYFRSLGRPSLSPSFVRISSAAIHSRRFSRTTECPRNPSSLRRSECNHLGCRDFTRIQIQPARLSLPEGSSRKRLYIDNGALDLFSLTIVFFSLASHVLLPPLS